VPDLSVFAITRKWPVRHPERIQLYSLPTPNGVKASIMLEECGLPYEPHLVSFDTQDQTTPEFRSLNPNGKIPAILDPDGPGGRPIALFESGAILYRLGEKTGKFLPADPAHRYETLQWGAGDLVGVASFANVRRALDAFVARPAVERGPTIPKRPPSP
jgi:GSH-dependent disulfide-bond oxidoreductase